MSLEVCARQGTQIVIHQDQVKQWTNAGADYAELFAEVRSQHNKRFLQILTPVLTKGSGALAVAGDEPEIGEEPGQEDAGAETHKPSLAPVIYDTMEKLTETEEVKFRCPSELSGVEVVCCKSGKLFLHSEKDRVVPKFSTLGGFGTGKRLGLPSFFRVFLVVSDSMVAGNRAAESLS